MSERVDRRIGGDRLVLWLLVAIFAVAAAAGAFVWLRLGSPVLPQKQALQSLLPLAQPARLDEPLTITLYYPEDGVLAAGTAAVKRQLDLQAQARETLAALFTDPRVTQSAIFKDIKLRELFLDASGTAYVDLSSLQQGGAKASAGEELLAVYTMVNTLTQNFEEIRQVRFLLEGKETQTLAGHIDLTREFEKRMDLVRQ
jgi:hypothetical protein